MTTQIFSDWLKDIDNSVDLKSILLFFDNCTSYKRFPSLKNFLYNLPPKTASRLQSLDQDIIRSYKVDYWKVQKHVDAIENDVKLPIMTIMDAMMRKNGQKGHGQKSYQDGPWWSEILPGIHISDEKQSLEKLDLRRIRHI